MNERITDTLLPNLSLRHREPGVIFGEQQGITNSKRNSLLQVLLSYLLRFAVICALFEIYVKVYTDFVALEYAYAGFFAFNEAQNLLEQYLTLAIVASTIPARLKKPSHFFILALTLLSVLPETVLYQHAKFPGLLLVHALVMLILLRALDVLPNSVGGPTKWVIDGRRLMYFLTALSVAITLVSIVNSGFSNLSLDFIDVYDRRANFFSQINPIIGYALAIPSKLGIVTLLIAIVLRDYRIFAVNFAIQLVLFAATGMKASLVLLLVAIPMFAIMKQKLNSTLLLAIVAIALLLSWCSGLLIGENQIWGAIVYTRTLYLPSWIDGLYFEYFQSKNFLWWSYSKLSFGLVEYAESITPGQVIGVDMWHGGNANAGYLGSGYMNAGSLGIAVYSLLITICVGFANASVSRGDGKSLAFVFVGSMSILLGALTSSDLPTMLVSEGGILTLFLIYVVSLNRVKSSFRSRKQSWSIASERNGWGQQ